jgi:hypothetical protein
MHGIDGLAGPSTQKGEGGQTVCMPTLLSSERGQEHMHTHV